MVTEHISLAPPYGQLSLAEVWASAESVYLDVEVAAITGHRDLKMLQRYTHLRAEDLARKLQ